MHVLTSVKPPCTVVFFQFPLFFFELNSIFKKKKLIMLNEVSANAFPK